MLLPEPLEPTSAVVVPAGASNETSLSTGTPGLYSNQTFSAVTRPSIRPTGRRVSSSSSSVTCEVSSRMRSSPANASLTCVPIDAIWTSGAATSPTKSTYTKKSPTVMCPAMIERPPTMIISAPTSPTMVVVSEPTAEMPVIDAATLRNRRCAPRAKTSCSRRSAT